MKVTLAGRHRSPGLTNVGPKRKVCTESGVVSEWPFLPRFPFRPCGNEIVAIRHSYLREALGIEDVGFLDDFVSIEHIGGRSVDFVRSERSRLRLGHSAVNEVPNRRGIRYQAKSDFHRLSIPEGYNPASQPAAAVWPMTGCALLGKDGCALFGGSTSRRQFFSVRADSDIPGLDFLFAWSASQLISASLRKRRDTRRESDHCREKTRGTAHFECSHPGSPSKAECH